MSKLFALVAGVVAVAGLYFARAVLVPFALAMLFSFLLTPLVRLMEKLRLPRVPAVLLVVILALTVAVFVGVRVTNQLVDVSGQLPIYRANIQNKVASLHHSQSFGLVRATEAVSELGTEMVETLPGKPGTGGQQKSRPIAESKSGKPVQVQVVTPSGAAWASMLTLLSPLAVAGVVLVFAVFILLCFEDLRNRFIRLVGHQHVNVTTQALDDASQRIGRYLLLQFIVNVSYGIVIGGSLHFIGLPHPLLWGVLAAAFRFLPFVGPPIAALLPIVLSLAVFQGWTRTLVIVGLYIVT